MSGSTTRFGPPTDSIARGVLALCARDPDGATPTAMSQALAAVVPETDRAGTLKWVIDVLANDGYLVEQSARWRFRSGLLRRYWVRHVV